MIAAEQAFRCFVGAWGFINATIVNTTTGAEIPSWHSAYPSGLSTYTESGYNEFIITANDTTQPQFRPRALTQPAKPTDSNNTWALVGQHSLAAGGTFSVINVTGGRSACSGAAATTSGPRGTFIGNYTTATLPSWVGLNITQQFEFFDNCNVHMLRSQEGPDVEEVVWFYRRPVHKVY
ncbi:uncharacterized protein PG998_003067 [Apiospora kogelbergensis]|uniref:uncharacterized protein n=1 Tax=Apiospora kogelbergensis TaxID=1337665 RepID=UPI003130595F